MLRGDLLRTDLKHIGGEICTAAPHVPFVLLINGGLQIQVKSDWYFPWIYL